VVARSTGAGRRRRAFDRAGLRSSNRLCLRQDHTAFAKVGLSATTAAPISSPFCSEAPRRASFYLMSPVLTAQEAFALGIVPRGSRRRG